MGNLLPSKHSQSLKNAYNPSMDAWVMVERRTQYDIWRNPITQEQIQEYRFMVNDSEEFQRQKQIFQARYSNDNLVSSRFFIDDSQAEFCSGYFKGNVFIQRIPFKLFEVEKIGFPEILHVYSQCLKGFAELYDAAEYFPINEEMIGINTDGVVKVWLNKDFGKSVPEPVYVDGTEREMMIRLVRVVSAHTQQGLPVNLADLILRGNPLNFRDAYIILESLATRHNIDIPDYLPSVFGKMRRMIKGESRISSEMYSGSRIIPVSQQSSRQNVYKKSIATDSILSFRETGSQGEKLNFKKMPVDYNSRNSMISGFPELSRISKVSFQKDRKVEYFPASTQSPSEKRPYFQSQPPLITPPATHSQSPTKKLPTANHQNPSSLKNTQLYYSNAHTKIPAEIIKHLPIVRQNPNHQHSQTSSKQQSFNYYVSDHNKLAERYLNKFRNSDQKSMYSIGNPQSFDLNYSQSKVMNQTQQHMLLKNQISPQSNISKFSAFNHSNISQTPRPEILYNRTSKVSEYNRGKTPIVSSSRTGVVYKETDLAEPSMISDQSMLNNSFSVDQRQRRISTVGCGSNPQLRKLGVIDESNSREIDLELRSDPNGIRRRKFVAPIK